MNHLLPGMQRMAPQKKKESLWRVFPLDFDGLIQGALKLVYVDPAYTSQTCAECHVTDKASRIDQARFICANCGHGDSADVNGARNIHQARALTMSLPSESQGGSARGSTQRSNMSPKLGSPSLSGWGVCHGIGMTSDGFPTGLQWCARLSGRSGHGQSPFGGRGSARVMSIKPGHWPVILGMRKHPEKDAFSSEGAPTRRKRRRQWRGNTLRRSRKHSDRRIRASQAGKPSLQAAEHGAGSEI